MLIFPRLNTARLILRKIEPDDIPALVVYANNKKITDRILNFPFPFREPDAAMRMGYVMQGFKQKTRYVFAIISKERSELIGEIGLHLMDKTQAHAQLSYWLGEPFWDQGLTTEAIKAIIPFGFEKLELNLIYADCHVNNIGSQKVLEKNGMSVLKKNGNLLLYQITEEIGG